MKIALVSLSILFICIAYSQESKTKLLDIETQIKLATHYLPEKDRNEARVLGYTSDFFELVVLRESDSHLTCVADDPKKNGAQLVCYYTELEDFITRGRVLKSEGVSPIEIRQIRGKEIEAGSLFFPEGQSMMYVMNGKEGNIDRETGVLKDGNLRYVIYIPYATQKSTGLPLSPSAPGMPWIMDPGTHRAHIMVTPL